MGSARGADTDGRHGKVGWHRRVRHCFANLGPGRLDERFNLDTLVEGGDDRHSLLERRDPMRWMPVSYAVVALEEFDIPCIG